MAEESTNLSAVVSADIGRYEAAFSKLAQGVQATTDRASAEFRKLERAQQQAALGAERLTQAQLRTQQSQVQTARATEQLTQAQNRTVQSTVRVAQANSAAAREQERLRREQINTERAAVQLQQQQLRLEQSQDRLGRSSLSLVSVYRTLRATLIGLALIRQVRETLDVAVAYDSLTRTLTAVRGSAAGARDELTFLEKLSQRLGFVTVDLGRQYGVLLGSLQATNLNLQVGRDAFAGLLEVGARFQVTSDRIGNALDALGKIVGQGTAQLDELQQQLGEQIPGFLPVLIKELGFTATATKTANEQFRAFIQTGKLTADVVFPAIVRAFHTLVGPDGLGETTESARANFARFTEAMNQARRAIGEGGLLPAATQVAKSLTEIIRALTGVNTQAQTLSTTQQGVRLFFQTIIDLGVGAKTILEGIATAVGFVYERITQGSRLQLQQARQESETLFQEMIQRQTEFQAQMEALAPRVGKPGFLGIGGISAEDFAGLAQKFNTEIEQLEEAQQHARTEARQLAETLAGEVPALQGATTATTEKAQADDDAARAAAKAALQTAALNAELDKLKGLNFTPVKELRATIETLETALSHQRQLGILPGQAENLRIKLRELREEIVLLSDPNLAPLQGIKNLDLDGPRNLRFELERLQKVLENTAATQKLEDLFGADALVILRDRVRAITDELADMTDQFQKLTGLSSLASLAREIAKVQGGLQFAETPAQIERVELKLRDLREEVTLLSDPNLAPLQALTHIDLTGPRDLERQIEAIQALLASVEAQETLQKIFGPDALLILVNSLRSARTELEEFRDTYAQLTGLPSVEGLTRDIHRLEDALILAKTPGQVRDVNVEIADLEEQMRLLLLPTDEVAQQLEAMGMQLGFVEQRSVRSSSALKSLAQDVFSVHSALLESQEARQDPFGLRGEGITQAQEALFQEYLANLRQAGASQDEIESELARHQVERIRDTEREYERFRDQIEDILISIPEFAKDPLDTLVNLFKQAAIKILSNMTAELLDPLRRQLTGLAPAVQQGAQPEVQGPPAPGGAPVSQPGAPSAGQSPAAQVGSSIAVSTATTGAGTLQSSSALGQYQSGNTIAAVTTAIGGIYAGVQAYQALLGPIQDINRRFSLEANITGALFGERAGQRAGNAAGGLAAGAAGGAIAGTAIAPGIGTLVGAIVGAIAGGVLGGLQDIPRETRAGIRTSARRTGFEDNVAREGPFGFVGASDVLTRHERGDFLVDIADTFLKIDESIAALLTTRQQQVVREALQQQRHGPQVDFFNFDNEITDLIEARFTTILQALPQAGSPAGLGARIAQTAFAGIENVEENVDQFVTQFQRAVEFINSFETFTNPKDLTQSEQALAAINDEFIRLTREAESFSLSVGTELTQGRDRLIADLRSGFRESIDDQILAIADPQALALRQLDRLQEERVREATALGESLVDIERLYALERERILQDSVERQLQDLESLRSFVLGLTASAQSPLPTQQRLTAAEAEFSQQRTAAFAAISAGMDIDQQALQQAAQNLIAISEQAFASGPQFFERFDFITRTLQTILAQAAQAQSQPGALAAQAQQGTQSAQAAQATAGNVVQVAEGTRTGLPVPGTLLTRDDLTGEVTKVVQQLETQTQTTAVANTILTAIEENTTNTALNTFTLVTVNRQIVERLDRIEQLLSRQSAARIAGAA